LPLFLTFFLFPAQTLSLLFGSRYTTAATALWILSLGAFINTILGPNGNALVAYGETRMVLYCSLAAAAIDVVLCLLLVPRIGISGAAIATASALGVSSIMYSSLLWIRHKLHPFDRKYVLTILFMFAIGVALYYPLRAAINRAHWLVLVMYPLFLIAGVLFIVLTRSISEEDRLLWRVVRERFRR
jgi:O-antigen/teichoic acid export membrane protein